MRTFIFSFIFISYMILTPVLLLPYLLIFPFSRVRAKTYVANLLSGTMKVMLKVIGVRLHVKGYENFPQDSTKPVLIVANHQSSWDIAILLTTSTRPIGFIAKKELGWAFPLNYWMKSIGCLFIDRKSPKTAVTIINQGVQDLKRGDMLGIFPEGTRSKGGDMIPFKRGSFKMALKADAAILPVTISGSYKSWEEKGASIQPANIYLTFHPLIELAGATETEREAISDRSYKVIHSEFQRLRAIPEDPKTRVKGGVVYE